LEIKEEKLWVGSGYLSNERETKGRSNLMSHKDVELPSYFSLRVFRERGEKKVVGKKRLVSTSLDSKSRVAMHWPFLKAFRATLKACSSILPI